MRKKLITRWILVFLLAALDVIGTDAVRMHSGDVVHEDQHSPSQHAKLEAQIREQLQVFPIPLSAEHGDYQVSYEDSWMTARTFGGDRKHEGTDLMLTPDQRGLFPVLSMTDGVVEKIGWLPQGGYRIGVRCEDSIYYYYAHLYDYAPEMKAGCSVSAGQLLGFAGDSGYSSIEGTVGNFPVHLHVGIYYDDAQGKETALNPYPFLRALESERRTLHF